MTMSRWCFFIMACCNLYSMLDPFFVMCIVWRTHVDEDTYQRWFLI